ncbi:MAG TPA: glycosyltransferase family 2 protein [Steroidobacteraceae bacterium]|jgi:glycosyltransferase involved in cell wall biosynthesis
MSQPTQPLVSVLTPVYNNAEHLPQCIESVLAQTYQNWDYLIVNNCSTDGSGEIARRYAAQDPRIRVHDNSTFLSAVPNHNFALRQISPQSKYTKFVFGDDWIFPTCLQEMVAVAEQAPSAGIVGCYGLDGRWVVWDGLPYPGNVLSGREVCRLLFLDKLYVLGTASSLLYRSDQVRAHDPFYNESNIHADTEACIALLRNCDFGFVHQVLAFTRQRPGSLMTVAKSMNTLLAARLFELTRYGPDFLSPEELRGCIADRLSEYYNFLAVSLILGHHDRLFWSYHIDMLKQCGVGFSRRRLAAAVAARFLRAGMNPVQTIEKLRS